MDFDIGMEWVYFASDGRLDDTRFLEPGGDSPCLNIVIFVFYLLWIV